MKTTQGRVLYIAAEGSGGFRNRLRAAMSNLTDAQRAEVTKNFGMITDTPNVLQAADMRDLIAKALAFRPDVIVVDTLAQVTPGSDENSSQDMGRALGNLRALQTATGATVVLVHHVGKDEARGARGWSGIRAAADAEITVSKDQYGRRATITKMKDGRDGLELPFNLREVPVDEPDQSGEVATSCVVQHVLDASAEAKARQIPRGKNERLVWDKLHALIDPGGDGVPVVTLIEHAKQELPYDPTKKKGDRRRELVLQAIRSLQDSKFIRSEDNVIKVNS